MSSIEHMIAVAAPQGIQINIWPCERGYQANVKETAGKGWTVSTNEDPLLALADALRHRLGGIATREIVIDPEPEQIDIEEAIAAAEDKECRYCDGTGYFYGDADLGPCGCGATPASANADDFDGLLG